MKIDNNTNCLGDELFLNKNKKYKYLQNMIFFLKIHSVFK